MKEKNFNDNFVKESNKSRQVNKQQASEQQQQ
jgi:hypothetical protein